MKRGRQGQASRPQSTPHPTAAACKSDSRKPDAEETGPELVFGDVIEEFQSLELSAALDKANEAAPFHPFELVPDELVVAIFAEIVASYIEPINRHKVPSRLLRISKRLHSIAVGTAHLWRTIVVSGHLDEGRLMSYLPRAGTIALDVYVYSRFAEEASSLLRQLFTIGDHQWRSLSIRSSSHKMTWPVLAMVPSNLNLETLIIKSNRPASLTKVLKCPNLQTLVLKGLHVDWRRLIITSLRRLELAFRQLNDDVWASFVGFLISNANQLQSLSIRFEGTIRGRPTNEKLQLGLLQTLRITDMSGEIVLPFLYSLEVPSLKVLELSGNGREWTIWNLEDNFESVEELKLHELVCGEEFVASLVKQLPNLHRVSLRMEGVRPNQVHSLMELNGARQIAWTIRLTAEDCSFDEEVPDEDFEAAEKELAWLAANSNFTIKDFRPESNHILLSRRLPVAQWELVDDCEWGKQVWHPPVRFI